MTNQKISDKIWKNYILLEKQNRKNFNLSILFFLLMLISGVLVSKLIIPFSLTYIFFAIKDIESQNKLNKCYNHYFRARIEEIYENM